MWGGIRRVGPAVAYGKIVGPGGGGKVERDRRIVYAAPKRLPGPVTPRRLPSDNFRAGGGGFPPFGSDGNE